jgi:hypothetical protein
LLVHGPLIEFPHYLFFSLQARLREDIFLRSLSRTNASRLALYTLLSTSTRTAQDQRLAINQSSSSISPKQGTDSMLSSHYANAMDFKLWIWNPGDLKTMSEFMREQQEIVDQKRRDDLDKQRQLEIERRMQEMQKQNRITVNANSGSSNVNMNAMNTEPDNSTAMSDKLNQLSQQLNGEKAVDPQQLATPLKPGRGNHNSDTSPDLDASMSIGKIVFAVLFLFVYFAFLLS